MSELQGLQNDPVYLGLDDEHRADYEAQYRKTFAGAVDELCEECRRLIESLERLVRELASRRGGV